MADHANRRPAMHRCYQFEIIMHDVGKSCPEGEWAQARYLVHGWDDTLWTNDLDEAVQFLRHSCQLAESERRGEAARR